MARRFIKRSRCKKLIALSILSFICAVFFIFVFVNVDWFDAVAELGVGVLLLIVSSMCVMQS